jgi:hypothetical protein
VRELLSKTIKAFLLILVLVCIDTTLVCAETKIDPTQKPLVLSLVFPGLGQLCEKSYFKGTLFFVAEIACIWQIIHLNRLGNTAYKNYQQAQTIDDTAYYRNQTMNYDKKRNLFIMAGCLVWVINLIDMNIYVKKKRKLAILARRYDPQTYMVGFDFCF